MSGNKSEWSNSQKDLAFYIAALQGRVKPQEAPVVKADDAAEDASVSAQAFAEEEAAHEEVKREENKNLAEGKRLFHMKRWENALKEFQLVDAVNADTWEQAELAYYLGLCYTKLERYDEAVLYLEQVVTVSNDPLRSYQCRMTLALIYIRTDRAKMAEFELKRLRNAGFESASMYNAMAYAAYLQKRYQQAVDYYEKALELDDNNATALNSMGYILADRGFDAVKGLRLCRKAVDIKPQSAAYMDSLGWAYYKCKEMIEARNWLKKAIDSAPKMNEIREHYRIVTGEAV